MSEPRSDTDPGPAGGAAEPTAEPAGEEPTAREPESGDGVPGDGATEDGATGETGGDDTDGGHHAGAEGPSDPGSGPGRSRRRRAAYATLRAVVVLVAAGVGYQAVVPTQHVERSRLSKLVLTKTGLPAYDKVKATASAQDDATTPIGALTAAAKKSPGRTGLYLADWSRSDQVGIGMIGLLLPTEASASTALGQIKTQQMAAGSYSSASLTRTSTFTVAGVPGSSGVVYHPSTKTAGSSDLVVTGFRQGRMVGVVRVAEAPATAQRDAEAVTVRQYAALRRLGSGLDLSVTRRSTVATVLWIVGSVLLAALAVLLPVARRRRAERRRRAYEEEMAHRVVVGSQVIVKYHRSRARP